MADDSPLFDLSQLNFDEFVSFFFNHDIEAEEFWHQDPALATYGIFGEHDKPSSSLTVGHMTRLFTNFAEVASTFSLPQVNAGIWAMLGPFRLYYTSIFGLRPYRYQHGWIASVPCTSSIPILSQSHKWRSWRIVFPCGGILWQEASGNI